MIYIFKLKQDYPMVTYVELPALKQWNSVVTPLHLSRGSRPEITSLSNSLPPPEIKSGFSFPQSFKIVQLLTSFLWVYFIENNYPSLKMYYFVK